MKLNSKGASSDEEEEKKDEVDLSKIKTEIKLNEPKLIMMESQKIIDKNKSKNTT